jgi:ATP-dependent DNA helicase RecG
VPGAASEVRLDTPVQFLKGVGAVRAGQLEQLGVRTLEDLLTYFPRRFDLRPQVQPIAALTAGRQTATVAGEVGDVRENRFGRVPVFQCTLTDATGKVGVRWFHGTWLRDRIKPGMHVAVSGPVSVYKGRLQFVNPRHQVLWGPAATGLETDEMLPVYPASGQLSSGQIARIIRGALPLAATLIRPWFDAEYLRLRDLMGRPDAVAAMHRPEDKVQWAQARRRLAYDECLLMQIGIGLTRLRQVSRPAHPLLISPAIDERIRARFPFPLTAAQDKAVGEIVADLGRDRPMNRLLQGDVGSGKTVVALYAALLAVARGKQAAVMAPTEILATQHYQKVLAYLQGSRVRIALLVGGLKPAQRQDVLARLAAGEIDLVVGTHALLSEGVRFQRLGLVVVDEQHKFGVRQRSSIRSKGFAPHYLVMTATPIPRTLALTVFGDLDVSTIDSLPPGRGRTLTRIVRQEELEETLAAVGELVAGGRQAYFIYPLVNASDQLELTAAEDAYAQLRAGPLGRFGVGIIHGQMPPAEKDEAMRAFHAGQIGVLVASVVVEVGLDVPGANVMVVMHAERFGLAQLHQLRGRIGRGRQDAVCILVASPANPVARKRLEVLERTADGFKIAEEDLRLRGPGEFFGTRQHGLPELKVADLIEDIELLRLARRDAGAILAEDPAISAPHHQQLRREVLRAYEGKLDLLGGA